MSCHTEDFEIKHIHGAYGDILKTNIRYSMEQKYSTELATKDMVDAVETNKDVDNSPLSGSNSVTDETPNRKSSR